MKKTAFWTFTAVATSLCAMGFYSCNAAGSATLAENKTYTVTDNVRSLELEINAADISIKEGEGFSVVSNLKNLIVKEQGNLLVVKDGNRSYRNYNGATCEITVPTDFCFNEVDITTGAGVFTADTLLANEVDFEFGAGKVTIRTLVAKVEADVDSGAGEVNILGGSLNNLDFDIGMGKLNLTASVLGRSTFDVGVGASNITILGDKDDYFINVKKGIGSITIDGRTLSGTLGEANGKNSLTVNGGVGSIVINFQTGG